MTYPIYVPSRGRADRPLTVKLLKEAGLDPWVVVEPHEFPDYVAALGEGARILELGDSNQGIAYARNWIKNHAMSQGHDRHWQLDDNIRSVKSSHGEARVTIDPSTALQRTETLVDQYTNVPIAGLMSSAFGHEVKEPFSTNKMVYCCVLVRSDDYRWDGSLDGIEDVDYSLQVLAGDECTILIKAYQVEKMRSGEMEGGNTDIYEEGGRLKRARALQRKWPGMVKIDRRWGRPRHNLNHVWRQFDQPLIRKDETK